MFLRESDFAPPTPTPREFGNVWKHYFIVSTREGNFVLPGTLGNVWRHCWLLQVGWAGVLLAFSG